VLRARQTEEIELLGGTFCCGLTTKAVTGHASATRD
jgi:hypothetical protein